MPVGSKPGDKPGDGKLPDERRRWELWAEANKMAHDNQKVRRAH